MSSGPFVPYVKTEISAPRATFTNATVQNLNVVESMFQNLNVDELVAKDAIIEKLRATDTGSSISVYNPLSTYDTGDVVFYHGCIFTSLIDGNTTEPTQESPDWNKISNLRNERVFIVNNLVGNDSKAANEECSNYPFATLDACIDYADLTNPTGGYKIILQDTYVDYPLSRSLSKDNISIYSFGVSATSNRSTVRIKITAQVEMSGFNQLFVGLFFVYDDIPAATWAMTITGVVLFHGCHFSNETGSDAALRVTSSSSPTYVASRLTLSSCFRLNTASATIRMAETGGVPLGALSKIVLYNCTDVANNFNIIDQSDPLISTARPAIQVLNSTRVSITSSNADVIVSGTDLAAFVNTANSPSYINIVGASFTSKSGAVPSGSFSKTGTADYYIVNCDLPASYTLAPGLISSVYRNSSPMHNYTASNNYAVNNVVFSGGEIYNCIAANTIGITPGEATTTNWAPLTKLNQLTSFGTPGAASSLATGLTTTSTKLNIPTLSTDPWDILGTVTANSFILNYAGLYLIQLSTESATTQTSGENGSVDIFVNLSSTSDIATALVKNTITRGLVTNTATYPANTESLNLYLSVPVASPLIGVALSIYARNMSSQAFNCQIVKMMVMRVRAA